MELIWISIISFLTATLLTWLMKCYSFKKGIIDIPNFRSSHKIPTPRGGGVSFVITFLVFILILTILTDIKISTSAAFLAGGGIIGITGYIDDKRNLNSRLRIFVHFASASIGVYLLGGLPPLCFFGEIINLGIAGDILAVIGTIWILNLNNFMDGIDGIASTEAITILLTVAGFLFYFANQHGETQNTIFCCIALASSVAGFLTWNFPPAKIFMGDAGSAFLGIILAFIGIRVAHINPDFFWITLTMIGVFMVDATLTLCVRIFRREKAYEAHRSHAYQFASRKHGHRAVTLSVLAINIIWLTPISWSIAARHLDGATGMIIAYLPLIFLAYKFKAGQKEEVK